ncbi:hypothetical protein TNCV_3175841 [Trichonephila clavipes]|nr:hypothetical protein TNCV_3175841 [Trichonephila clavipes]
MRNLIPRIHLEQEHFRLHADVWRRTCSCVGEKSASRLSHLVFFDGVMDHELYLNILKEQFETIQPKFGYCGRLYSLTTPTALLSMYTAGVSFTVPNSEKSS